jgi:hypothetical protein
MLAGLEEYFMEVAPILREHGPEWTQRFDQLATQSEWFGSSKWQAAPIFLRSRKFHLRMVTMSGYSCGRPKSDASRSLLAWPASTRTNQEGR